MAFHYPDTAPLVSNQLNEHFGHEIELINDDNVVEAYVIKKEFVWGDSTYVALQNDELKAEDEVDFLKVIIEGESIELESISDEEEWEAVSEAYDDLLFTNDDQP